MSSIFSYNKYKNFCHFWLLAYAQKKLAFAWKMLLPQPSGSYAYDEIYSLLEVTLCHLQECSGGLDRPGRQSGGAARIGVIKGASAISRLLWRQNCSPPRAPITHITPLVIYLKPSNLVTLSRPWAALINIISIVIPHLAWSKLRHVMYAESQ